MFLILAGTEFVGPSQRVVVGIAGAVFFALGLMILAGLASLIREWRLLEVAITVPVAFLFLYIP